MQDSLPNENLIKTKKAIVEALKENDGHLYEDELEPILQKKIKNTMDKIKAIKELVKEMIIKTSYKEDINKVLITLLLDEDEQYFIDSD
ncbi:MAG: hypothetical protein ACM3S4_07525 [Burkholderiales bacterium]